MKTTFGLLLKMNLILGLIAVCFSSCASGEDFSGNWQGTLSIPSGELEIIIELEQNTGASSGSMKVPAQNLDVKLKPLTIQNKHIHFEIKSLGVVYSGDLNVKTGAIEGRFQQGPKLRAKLDFKKQSAEQAIVLRNRFTRKQTPKPPFSYQVKEVSIFQPHGGFKLSGTLTYPKNGKSLTAAILVSGSGPQDRDETIIRHKPFAVIADYLTKRGIAVLRFDDRGTAKSGGQYEGSGMQDFANDVQAAFDYLKTQEMVDPKKIGIIGHSEGGIHGPLMASNNREVAFLITLAGIGTSPKHLYARQQRDILLQNGAQNGPLIYNTFKIAIDRILDGADTKELSELFKKKLGYPEKNAQIVARFMSNPWFKSLMSYDNESTLKKIDTPFLALNGSKDIQVNASDNLSDYKKYLTLGGNEDVTVKEIPGLNHLFQPSKTGSISEYASIPITFDEQVLKLMGDWILERF